MPMIMRGDEPKHIAETPEFQALQKQIRDAEAAIYHALSLISNQIVAVEAKMNPMRQYAGPKAAGLADPEGPEDPVGQQPQRSFEQSIAEMQ